VLSAFLHGEPPPPPEAEPPVPADAG
jgi:hypothetical protein